MDNTGDKRNDPPVTSASDHHLHGIIDRRPPFDWRWWAGGAVFLVALALLLLAVSSTSSSSALRSSALDQHDQIRDLQIAVNENSVVVNCRAKIAAEYRQRDTTVNDEFNEIIAAGIAAQQATDDTAKQAAREQLQAAISRFTPAQQARASIVATSRAYEADTSKPCPI